MTRFQCEECGSYDYLDREGSGEDKFGEYEAFSFSIERKGTHAGKYSSLL